MCDLGGMKLIGRVIEGPIGLDWNRLDGKRVQSDWVADLQVAKSINMATDLELNHAGLFS